MARTRKIVPDYRAIIREHEEDIMEIDCMPMDGDRRQKYAAFQRRRLRQMDFILARYPEMFPGYPLPSDNELRDFLGVIKTDSLLDAMFCLEDAAISQHVGRGVIIKDKDGTPVKKGGRVQRTKRKLDNPLNVAKKIARERYGNVPEILTLPEPPQQGRVTVREDTPLSLPSPQPEKRELVGAIVQPAEDEIPS